MDRQERGYATLTVSVLMLGLSLIAVAITERAAAKRLDAHRLSERILSDIYQEGSLFEALGTLINQPQNYPASQARFQFSAGGQSASITTSSLRNLINVNQMSPLELSDALEGRGIESDLRTEILAGQRRGRATTPPIIFDLSDLGESEAFEAALPCLRRWLTVFQDPARTGDREPVEADPHFIHLRSQSPGSTQAVEAVILITGHPDEPFWIFDWSFTGDTQNAPC